MQYKELIQFEPITSVVKLVSAGETAMAENLVKTFVFSQKIQEDIQEVILKNLNPTPNFETKGIQIVGSYGTGKSHLMSLVSAIAENENLLTHLASEELQNQFRPIAGVYKVLRFEIGTDRPLKDIIFAQIERYLDRNGVNFAFDQNSSFSWKESLQNMMAEFEEKYPRHHFLMVIDELLEYLKGREPGALHNDLMLLRQLGELCDNSRFKLMFGVQELLYRSSEFRFQADMLNKIEDRYADLTITKEDVSFVVKERLLKKNIHQKAHIREHLQKFAPLFEGINNQLNEYVDLFPVHPTYIHYFERVKHGKSQREILKVLSSKFQQLAEENVPSDKPGLITYDSYWKDIAQNPAMLTIPDIRAIKDKVEIIQDRINSYFIGARSNKKELAASIANALAIRILCDDLGKRNGANAESLKEDLCITLPNVAESEFLLANIGATASQLVTATAGQYVDKDSLSNEFYIRTEGGVNVPQLIRDYADEVIKRNLGQADQYYFEFLQSVLELNGNPYRTGFPIWEHTLEWIDKKSFQLGYIFFGNPNEKSTTQPIQQYYIFFCPLFGEINRNDNEDEVYFEVSDMSEDFKDTICLYGAAKSKEASAPSNQKKLFQAQIDEYLAKAQALFSREYADKTNVIYKGKRTTLKSYPLLGEGTTKELIFRNVAAKVLNKHFNDTFPHYPAFSDLLHPLSKENFPGAINAALKKIVAPQIGNRTGEAILSGLGLWTGQNIDIQNSKYADSILQRLKEKGVNTVLNRNDILFAHSAPYNLWYSIDFKLDYQLTFVVLAALTFKGDIEIHWAGNKTLTASNIELLLNLSEMDFYSFQHLKQPQGIPYRHLKALFECLGMPDYSTELEKPETIFKIIEEAKIRANTVVRTKALVAQGLKCRNVALLSPTDAQTLKTDLEALANLLDSIQSYTTFGKLKAFRFTEEELKQKFKAFAHCAKIDKLKERADKFEKWAGYLHTAQSYIQDTQPLSQDISNQLQQLSQKLLQGSEAEILAYGALLNALIENYADYYLAEYTKYRLSNKDALIKERLLKSEEKQILAILQDVAFLNVKEFQDWLQKLSSLREADIHLTKAKVLQEPYHDFSPREFQGKPLLKVSDLETQLPEILEKWTKSLKGILKDPNIQENMDILEAHQRQLIQDFKEGKIGLSLENAHKIRSSIALLSQGIDKVEVNIADLKSEWTKPLSPNEAIAAFAKHIDSLCEGRERNKVRIILK